MANPTKLPGTLKLYRVTSLITGALLLTITVLFTLRLGTSHELWFAGPHGLFSLEQFNTDSLGNKIGLPSSGFDLTTVALIVHGWFYMLYLYSDYRLWNLMRWSFKRFIVIAAGGVVPLLSFFTEYHYHRIAVQEAAAQGSQA